MNRIFIFILLSSLLCAGSTFAQDLLRHQINAVSKQDQLLELAQVLEASDHGVEPEQLQSRSYAGRAAVSLQSMFSSQEGSWAFEPFVHNGMFRVIANYQTHHPKVVFLSGGGITLSQLYAALGDDRIMSKHKDGYLLSYPLLIAPGAALNLENVVLYLRIQSGTALINQGDLKLQHSTLTSWSGGNQADVEQSFRPFVIAWAGSRTRIVDSSLTRLGYKAHLSQGLTLAHSLQQASNLPPPILLIQRSKMSEMASGAGLQRALARIENSQFEAMQQYAIDLQDSRVSVIGNRITDIKNQSAVRIRGASSGVLERNIITDTGKAGIEVQEQQGDLVLRNNTIGSTHGNGILLRRITSQSNERLLLVKNYISNTTGSSIDGESVNSAYIIDNTISSTPEYAISFQSGNTPTRLFLATNQLDNIGKAMIRTKGVEQILLGNNHYRMAKTNQQLMGGDLMPIQSLLMETTVINNCFIEVHVAINLKTGLYIDVPNECRRGG